MKKKEKRKHIKPAAVSLAVPDSPLSRLDPIKVRLAATRELLGILGEEQENTRFLLPPPQETFFANTPEQTFCLLVQNGYDLNSLQIATSYSRAAVINALVALACGADVSRVAERRVA
jgi:hypothetical protein